MKPSPYVHGPSTPHTDGENHRTVTLSVGRQRLSIKCANQEQAFALKGKLISAFLSTFRPHVVDPITPTEP